MIKASTRVVFAIATLLMVNTVSAGTIAVPVTASDFVNLSLFTNLAEAQDSFDNEALYKADGVTAVNYSHGDDFEQVISDPVTGPKAYYLRSVIGSADVFETEFRFPSFQETYVTYDFGSVLTLDKIAIFEGAHEITRFDLNGSTDGVNFSPILTGVMPTDPILNFAGNDFALPQIFDFATPFTGRYVQFMPTEARTLGSNASLGEIIFSEVEPAGDVIPAPLAAGLIVALGFAQMLRRNRRA